MACSWVMQRGCGLVFRRCLLSSSSCLAPAPSIARLQSKPQRRDVDSRDRTCTQRHWCVATRRRRAVLCCAVWCRGFLINKRRAAVVDCSIFAISRHGPGTLRPFAGAFRNRGAPTRPLSRDRNQRNALRFWKGAVDWRAHSNVRRPPFSYTPASRTLVSP